MKAEILALLRSGKEHISGQELCEHFGVSRTAVWKVMNQLKSEGYEIEAVQNKGYKLLATPDLLNASELKSRLNTNWAGCRIEFRETTGSTNTDAKKLAEEQAPHGTIAMTNYQSAGKGRRGKSWDSPAGENIYFTILLRPSIVPEKAPMLTLVMALSVARALTEKCGDGFQIKWPNDVVLNGKKICGILTEMSLESDYIQYVITGVGINVNQKVFPKEICDKATSLCLEFGNGFARAGILQEILKQYEIYYPIFEETLSLENMMEEYNRYLVNCQREVMIIDPRGEWSGTALGINEAGELLVKDQAGQTKAVYAGEVSVRGIYGYV